MTKTLRRLHLIMEARSWIETPFQHQAAVKGAGVDCANLIRAVGEDCGEAWADPAVVARHKGYGRQPNPRAMRRALEDFMVPIALHGAPPTEVALLADAGIIDIGDVAWLQWRQDLPMHLAILSVHDGRPYMIHALADFGFVVEHGFNSEWPVRVHSWWRYPGLE